MDVQELWSWEVRLFPLLLVIGLSEGITLLRRWTRKAYVPLYFLMVQSSKVDEKVAQYYLQTWYPGAAEPELDDEEAKKLRQDILLHSVWGVLLYTWMVPIGIAAVTSQVLTPAEFPAVLVFFASFQLYKIGVHLIDWASVEIPGSAHSKWAQVAYAVCLAAASYTNLWVWDSKDRGLAAAGGFAAVVQESWQTLFVTLAIGLAGSLIGGTIQANLLDSRTRKTLKEEYLAHVAEADRARAELDEEVSGSDREPVAG